jgi:hypothetical protein
VALGKRNKQNQDDLIPRILKRDGSSKEFRKRWACLVQKIGAGPGLDPGRSIPLRAFYLRLTRDTHNIMGRLIH